jgi:toxin YoeB
MLWWHWQAGTAKNNLSGWWSRRIDDVNRIVYKEKDGAVIIASCKGHYED